MDNTIEKSQQNRTESSHFNDSELATARIGKLLCKFSIPCVISLLVSALYNIVDQIFIGQGVGYLGNAATNVVCPITFIALGIAICIGDGSAAEFSLNLGKGKRENSDRVVGNAIFLSTFSAVILTACGFIFMPQLLELFGSTEVIFEYCNDYMIYILIGLPFFMLTNTMNALIRADGSPKFALFAVLLGAVINIILDPIAIFVLNLGVKGAAIATAIGQVASFAMSAAYFVKPKNYKLCAKSFIPNLRLSGRVLLLGSTSFLTQIAITIIIAVMNNVLVKYGTLSKYGSEIPLSVIGIVMKVFQIVISIVIGITVGAQPIVGFNYGAGNFLRVKKTYWTVTSVCIAISAIALLLFELCPQAIVSIFGNENELYNEFAVLCFRVYLSSIVLCSALKSSGVFLQIMGKPIQSVALSLCRDIIFMLPAVFILAANFDFTAILLSAPISDVLTFALTAVVMFFELKKLNRGNLAMPR